MSDEEKVTPPCKGCPFLRSNHGKRTKEGFYTQKNLRRLWSGIRNGERMICHATDPNAHESGSPAYPKPGQIKEGNERVCLGALVLWKREEALLIEAGGMSKYKKHPKSAKPPMNIEGFAVVANDAIFGKVFGGPKIDYLAPDMSADVGLPWMKQDEQG